MGMFAISSAALQSILQVSVAESEPFEMGNTCDKHVGLLCRAKAGDRGTISGSSTKLLLYRQKPLFCLFSRVKLCCLGM